MNRKTEKKVRLFYLLPYGLTSRSAMILATKVPQIAFLEYSRDIPMEERCKELEKSHDAATRQLDRMIGSRYIEDTNRRYGKNQVEQFRMVRLTRSGLYLLTSTQDPDLEKERGDHFYEESYRKLKENTYESDSLYDRQLRDQWYVAATDPTALKVDRETLEGAFLEAVYDGSMTILALDTALAKEVVNCSRNVNGWQLYRDWRLSNINALFMANGFLTFLDRRPMDTGWTVYGIQNEESFDKRRKEKTLDIPAFMYHALNRWYSEHPESYLFSDPGRELTEKNMQEWKTTPAFYSAVEIPGFYYEEDTEKTRDMTGEKNVIRHSFCGVAIGKKTTYIVHHTRPGKTPWSENVERTTVSAVRKALRGEKAGTNIEENDEITSAIMVCHSVHQFAKLFAEAEKNMAKKWRKAKRVGLPYDTVSIVPINASGAMQIRGLLLMTPSDFELYIMGKLQAQDSRFERTQEALYQMNFNNVPVLIAHSMNFQKLYWALEDYRAGIKFYVSCYPGQTKYIRKIMPDVEFL